MTQKKFGERIQAIRDQLHLSQSDLADLCNLEPSHISAIEHGKKNVTLLTIDKIVTALGLTIGEILGEETPKITKYDTETAQIMANVSEMTPSQKRILIGICKVLRREE